MWRRVFLGGLLAPLLALPGRAADRPRISILHSGFPLRTPIHMLINDLKALGYEDDRSASIDVLGGEGDPERLRKVVAQIIATRPNVIVAITTPAVLALKSAAVDTPVVFGFVFDPVGAGLVQSLAHPGGNFTGITFSDAKLGAKRLEFLANTLPGLRRVAVLWTSSWPEHAVMLDSVRRAAASLNIEVVDYPLRGAADLAPSFAAAHADGAQAAVFMSDNVMFGRRKEIAALAIEHRLPSIHSFTTEAQDGGLLAFSADFEETYRRIAALVDRIVKGARPADLPVEEPTKFTLSVNLKTAAALQITIPPSILALADEVIE
jgi:putative tryptophan/tyrosine transport system substrate-binding protein